MSTFATLLAALSDDAFAASLAASAQAVQRDHRFFPNEVEPATRVLAALRRGARTLLLAHPMQSGKTNIMAATTHILRAMMPSVRALYVCANDQLDLRRQNCRQLVPHVEVLTRSERRKAPRMELRQPTIFFYDESHFGDGAEMTIEDYLVRQGVFDDPLAVFLGVSATPMSSIGCLDETIWADLDALEAAGYNSPRTMLAKGRICEAVPLFFTPKRAHLGRNPTVEDVAILTSTEPYRRLADLLNAPVRQGYVMIRCHRIEAEVLGAHLESTWGSRVYVEHWNQHNKVFSAETFFSQRRFGVITVVLVQHKARMGSVIPTEDCHFMYEPASRRSSVDTIAQSFLGRACGFGKQGHLATIYTRPEVAEAYVRLMSRPGQTEGFATFCRSRGLKPSLRAEIASGGHRFRFARLDVIRAAPKDSAGAIQTRCRGLIAAHNLRAGRGHVRTLSAHQDPVKAGLLDVSGRARLAKAEGLCGPNPGDWTIVTYDRRWKAAGQARAQHEKGIVLAIRGDKLAPRGPKLAPLSSSMHFDLRLRREARRPRQGSLGFSPPAAAWAAAAP